MNLWDADSESLGALKVKLLTTEDIPALVGLRNEVLAGLGNVDLYSREPDESAFVRSYIGTTGQGETLGVFNGNRLVAYGMLGFPDRNDAANLGCYFHQEKAELARTGELVSCMVSEPYRGRRLQRVLVERRLALARSRGRDFCVAMASLHNHASRRNLMREGFRIGWVGELSGLRRHLLAIDLAKSWAADDGPTLSIDANDWERQRELTQQGWWGVDSTQISAEQTRLVFAKHP